MPFRNMSERVTSNDRDRWRLRSLLIKLLLKSACLTRKGTGRRPPLARKWHTISTAPSICFPSLCLFDSLPYLVDLYFQKFIGHDQP
jgi:hypothetical protein